MNVFYEKQHVTHITRRYVAPRHDQDVDHSFPARRLLIDFHQVERDYSQRLGRGRYGDVFRGELHGTPVAVKEIAFPRSTKGLRKSDIKEIEVCASISHPSIVLLMAYSFGQRPRENCLLLIFEFVNGHNLDEIINDNDLIQEYGLGNLSKKYDILFQASQAVAYLHTFKPTIVHGDIKPSNIMLGRNGRVKVCDFGLSKLKETSSLTLSTTAAVAGTPLYLAPEQLLHGKTSSIQSDVYAFGATAHEVIFECLLWDLDDSINPEYNKVTRLKKKIQAERIPSALHKKQEQPCYSLILSCVQLDYWHRADALTIVSELEKLCKSV